MVLSLEDQAFLNRVDAEIREFSSIGNETAVLNREIRLWRMTQVQPPINRDLVVTREDKLEFVRQWQTRKALRLIDSMRYRYIYPAALQACVDNKIDVELGFFGVKVHSYVDCAYCDECNPELELDLGTHYGNLCQYFECHTAPKRNKARTWLPETLKSAVDVLEEVYKILKDDLELLNMYYEEFEHYCLSAVYGITQEKSENLLNSVEWLLDSVWCSSSSDSETEEGTLSDLTDE